MLGYKPTTSAATKIALSEIEAKFRVFFYKITRILMYDHPSALKVSSDNLKIPSNFSAGVLELEIFDRPGTLCKLL